jgi:hypothetical protein
MKLVAEFGPFKTAAEAIQRGITEQESGKYLHVETAERVKLK